MRRSSTPSPCPWWCASDHEQPGEFGRLHRAYPYEMSDALEEDERVETRDGETLVVELEQNPEADAASVSIAVPLDGGEREIKLDAEALDLLISQLAALRPGAGPAR